MKSVARFLFFLLFVLIVVSGFVFTLRNSTAVGIWLGVDLAPRPIGLWLVLAFSAGSLLGLLLGLGLWRRLHNRVQVRQLRSRLLQAEKELAVLKQAKPTPQRQDS